MKVHLSNIRQISSIFSHYTIVDKLNSQINTIKKNNSHSNTETLVAHLLHVRPVVVHVAHV